MKKNYWVVILFVLGCWLVNPTLSAPVLAQQGKYTVQQGDTLWGICEKVYGNADLWPQLWEMNRFITNPHLLKPGDTITLFSEVPQKREPAVKGVQSVKLDREELSSTAGVDVSGLTNVNDMGRLSTEPVAPWGFIFSTDTERMILSSGDMVFVRMEEGRQVKPGDLFTVYKSSVQLKHPFTGKMTGYVLSYLGKLAITEHVRDNLYKADVVESYRAVRLGDTLIPYQPVSPCVQLVPSKPDLTTQVVAVKDQMEIIGQFSVVYLPLGYNDGVLRGNLFDILKRKAAESAPSSSLYASKERIALPDLVVGHILVIEATPDTATCVVISAKENVANGVSVRGLSWTTVPGFISMLPECNLE